MSKKILLLGAGFVAKPLVKYLLEVPSISNLTVGDMVKSKAQDLLGNHPKGKAIEINVDDEKCLNQYIAEHDLAISLLPYIHHLKVANLCIKHKKHLVTTSYVSPAMKALDSAAKSAGVLFLNEMGLDPGIDHMSAKKIIDDVHDKGGQIESFRSICGGLPAPDANDNPYGYKFSWSPRGVVLAARNNARYLKNGKIVETPGKDLFSDIYEQDVETIGRLEVYPNRDSVPYAELYSISEAKTVFRGTFRNIGWCRTWKVIANMNYLDEQPKIVKGKTYRDLTAEVAGLKAAHLTDEIAKKFKLDPKSDILMRLNWLGLLGDEKIPFENSSPLDILVAKLQSKMEYKPGERDMVVLVHDFVANYPKQKRKENITSTLIDFGIPHGDSSMSRTVSLPAAIGVRLIAEGKLKDVGVKIPVERQIYGPILKELSSLNVVFKESVKTIS